MESRLLPISPCKTQEHSDSTDALIREWLFRFSVEHKEDVAPRLPLWLEAFGGMDPVILESLFKRALKTCRFFPKVSEILAPLETTKQAILPVEANNAWLKVLSIRRTHYNPDFPDHLRRAVSALPERVQQAARAAGVWQEFETPDQLHIWAKKRFIASYLAWQEIDENHFLLPENFKKDFAVLVEGVRAFPSPSLSLAEMTKAKKT